MRAATLRGSKAGGFVSFEHSLRHGEADVNGPWRWLSAVAAAAGNQGDSMLAARVFLFAYFWCEQFVAIMSLADCAELGLGRTPNDLMAEIASTGLVCLERLAPETVVVDSITGVVRVENLSDAAALTITDLHKQGEQVEPEVRLRAEEILQNRT